MLIFLWSANHITRTAHFQIYDSVLVAFDIMKRFEYCEITGQEGIEMHSLITGKERRYIPECIHLLYCVIITPLRLETLLFVACLCPHSLDVPTIISILFVKRVL